MGKRSKSIDIERIKTVPLQERPSKVDVKNFCKPYERGKSFKGFLDTLPNTLASRDIKEVARRVAEAYQKKKPIIFGMGAHVIKVGLNPLIIDLMKKGVLSCIAMNGAGAIHDVEIALSGKTSEDVLSSLQRGEFGMAGETADVINHAVKTGVNDNRGMGESIGEKLLQLSAPYNELSLLAMASKSGIPITVHVSIGTEDIPSVAGHSHESADITISPAGHKSLILTSKVMAASGLRLVMSEELRKKAKAEHSMWLKKYNE